jgi:aspartate/methionine/tyrosine aminotransferase
MLFPENDIINLVGAAPQHDLGESVGPNLRLARLVGWPMPPDLAETSLGYATAEGNAQLRNIIADSHGVGADEVVITVGGVHALFLAAFILCGRGDEAVMASPVFPPTRTVLQTVGAAVRVLPLSFSSAYQVDPRELQLRLSPRTKLVSLASPQNPSGVSVSLDCLKAILEIMQDICPAAYLLVDETYREAAYGDDAVAPSAAPLARNVISVASLSKCHGTPGLRIGWVTARDATLRRQFVLGKFNTVISCSTSDETLALALLSQKTSIVAERRRQLAAGLEIVTKWIDGHDELLEWIKPDAGALCCVRLKSSSFDEFGVREFYSALTPLGVRVANGAWFGDEARVFRLGFGFLPAVELQAALDALSCALKKSAKL